MVKKEKKKKKGIKKENKLREDTANSKEDTSEHSELTDVLNKETELENIIKEEQEMSTTFTPFNFRQTQRVSPTLEQNPINEPIQNLEADLRAIPGENKEEDKDKPNYEPTPLYSETPKESSQQISNYISETPKEAQSYDTQQTMVSTQRFDASTGITLNMQDERAQFQQWHNAQMDPFAGKTRAPAETYVINPQKIDDTKNLPFKKNKKKNPFGF